MVCTCLFDFARTCKWERLDVRCLRTLGLSWQFKPFRHGCQRGCRGFKSLLPLSKSAILHWRFSAQAFRLRDGRTSHAGPMLHLRGLPAMNTDEPETEATVSVTDEPAEPESAPKAKLEIEVAITDAGPCKKHL